MKHQLSPESYRHFENYGTRGRAWLGWPGSRVLCSHLRKGNTWVERWRGSGWAGKILRNKRKSSGRNARLFDVFLLGSLLQLSCGSRTYAGRNVPDLMLTWVLTPHYCGEPTLQVRTWGWERGKAQLGQSWLQTADFCAPALKCSCLLLPVFSCQMLSWFPAGAERISFWMMFKWVRRVASLSTAVVEEKPAGSLDFQGTSEQQEKT